MADKTWKKNERMIASRLNGRRVPVTGRQRGDAPDVAHPRLAVECKHRRAVPAWLTDAMDQARASAAGTDKLPIAVIHEHGTRHSNDLVVMTLADFAARFAADDSSGILQTCDAAGAEGAGLTETNIAGHCSSRTLPVPLGAGVSAETENPHDAHFPTNDDCGTLQRCEAAAAVRRRCDAG